MQVSEYGGAGTSDAVDVFAPGHIGELTQVVPFELVDAVLEETRTRERRLRDLPSRVGVYFVLALGLFEHLGARLVWEKLVTGLSGPVPRPSEKALRDLRRRIGFAPLQQLFDLLAVRPLAEGASWGHAWESARLTPFALRDGRAPTGADEIVADASSGLRTGAKVTVQSTGAPSVYEVVGIAAPAGRDALARQSTLFFSTEQARRLAGHPGQVSALGLLTVPGATVSDVRARALEAVSGTPSLEVRSGDDRGPVEFIDAGKARVSLISLGGAMGGTSLLVALLVVAGTFALSIQQRARELALLRAVGATPRQLRRMVGREALVVGLLAGPPGAVAGLFLARWMHGRFVAVGALPDTLELTVSAFPPVAAFLATLLAAWGAARVSARGPARMRPTEGLAAAALGSERPHAGRVVAGVLAAVGYVVLVVVLSGLKTDAAATPVTFLSVIVAAAAIALLGPSLARSATWVTGGIAQRISPASGFLAARNTRAGARRVAAVVTPLSLAVAMASTILFTQTTSSHSAGEQAASGTRAPYVLTASEPGVPTVAAQAVRERVPGTTVTEVVRTTVRIGQDKFPAQGVSSPGLARTLDPEVTAGTLAAMGDGTVALSELAARTRHAQVGDHIPLTLGDGVKKDLEVSAVYERGLGFGDLLLPHRLVAAHVDQPLSSSVLVAGAPSRSALTTALRPFPTVHVLDRTAVAAARRTQEGAQAQVNYIAMGLVIAFTAIAVVNTLVMSTSARRRELALLRMIGTTGRQLRAMLRWETLTVTLLAIALGAAVACATLTAYSLGMTGAATPYAPLVPCLAVIATAVLLAFVSTALPARAAQRSGAGTPTEVE
ncbi:transposase domain-containing protein [Streptomyces sp. NBC_01320]|uniref:transposase domain-containing protein n=1 Tax=Streptomyces sp. NBC_01320 TaxID=2903824 RepID=UPI003FA3D93A